MSELTENNSKELLNEYLSSRRPLVSVICTSYNHEPFITQALESVVGQTYQSIELIVIDNGSSDGTVRRVESLDTKHIPLTFIENAENVGLCRAFNQGLRVAKGRYVIDLSADDVLHPYRVEKQIQAFDQLPQDYGVVFTNASFINADSKVVGYHYDIDAEGRAVQRVPTGQIFKNLIASYVVCTPTMMIRREVLDELNGYDETLAYEDFDFWIRSARAYRYHYLDAVLTSKRVLNHSLSSQFSRVRNALLPSTLSVCYKAFDQCQTPEEYQALVSRLRWCIRQCFYAQHYELAFEFGKLMAFIEQPDWTTRLILSLCRFRLPVNNLYRQYLNWQMQRLKKPVFQ